MRRTKTLAPLLFAGLAAMGCTDSRSGGSGGPPPVAETPSPPPLSPPPPTTSDPALTGPTSPTEQTPPAGVPAALRIEGVEVPASVQPGERMRVEWRTVSDAPVTDTHVRWGTTPQNLDQTTGRTFESPAGSFSKTDSFPIRLREGSVYAAVFALDARGNRSETPPIAIPVLWTAPAGALVASSTTAVPIAPGATVSVPLSVTSDTVVDAVEVRVDLEHPRRGDLTIDVIAPSGRALRLYDAPADEGTDLLGTFGNDMVPAESLNTLRGERVGGRWTLRVTDAGSPSGGSLRMWALVITPRVETATREEVLPNLVAQPPEDVSIVYVRGTKSLAFGSRIRNPGPGPCQLRGDLDRTTGRTRAFQQVMSRLRDPATGKFLGWELSREILVGDLVFDGHETHDHWHMAEVATYTIRDESFRMVAGVDALKKLTRCLTDSRRYDFRPIEGSPAQRTYLCGQARQGISVAWEDNYGAGTDGQYLGISALPDGTYYIVSELMTRLEEAGDDVDNNAATKIRVRGDSVEVLERLDGRALAARRRESAP